MNEATHTPTYRVLGTADYTTCHCCGREDLKHTIALAILDADGNHTDTTYFGTTCAAHATKRTTKVIREEVKNADTAAREAARTEQIKRQQEEDKRWTDFLTTTTGIDGDLKRPEAIRALGGLTAAFAAYRNAA